MDNVYLHGSVNTPAKVAAVQLATGRTAVVVGTRVVLVQPARQAKAAKRSAGVPS